MVKYWALDYINGELGECELVYNDQLYATEDEAISAREATGRPDLFDTNWYSKLDLEELYNMPVSIDKHLRVHYG